MPLVRFDLIKGRTDKEIADLLDAAHEAMLEAFRVPVRDRYQIVQEHDASRVRIEDTGLGIERTDKVVIVTVTSPPAQRSRSRTSTGSCVRPCRRNAASRQATIPMPTGRSATGKRNS